MSIVVSALLTGALAEIRVARAGDVLAPEMQDLALQLFNELIDALNADNRALYTVEFATYGLTPTHQPHTIGPSGDFDVPQRPTEILYANLILTNDVRHPLTLRDDAWWRDVRLPTLASTMPSDLYYNPAWPLGAITLWPISTLPWGLELETRVQLTAPVTATDTLNLPQGYPQALRLTLAELCAPAFGQTVSAGTAKNARDARSRVWGNNLRVPTLVTWDAGMPGQGCWVDDGLNRSGGSGGGNSGFQGGFQ